MSRRQLLALFLCSLVPWTIGNGLAPLLPLYAIELGASPAEAGSQLALTYAALAAGTVAAGWLSHRLRCTRALIIGGGVLSVPAVWLMGRLTDPWELAAVAVIWCFWAGISISLLTILAGLTALDNHQGRVFGVLALNAGLGALLGGLAMGPIAERWGFPTLFTALALFTVIWPICGFSLHEGKAPSARQHTGANRQRIGLGRSFYCLFLGSLAALFAAYVFIAGRSLVMADLGFGATAISTTSALSEVPILPLPLLLGRLSDRFGRRRSLALGYLAASAGLMSLTASGSLWQFWVSSILVTVSLITSTVGAALVADLVPRQALSKGLALYGATTWIAGILGCTASGYAIQHLGPVFTFAPVALLPLAAVGLLLATHRPARGQRPVLLPTLGRRLAVPPASRPQVVPTAV